MKPRLILILLVILECACVPFGFVTPPVEIQGGAAASSQDELELAVPVRIDAQPLQLVRRLKDRGYDLGLGYLFVPGTGTYVHGPGGHAGLLFGDEEVPLNEEDGLALRWGASARANLLFAGGGFGTSGWGVGLQGRVEWVRFSTGPFEGCTEDDDHHHDPPRREPSQDPHPPHHDEAYEDDDPTLSCVAGWAEGEGSVGFFVEASHAQIASEDFTWFGAGILFRLPASAGVGFATIF